MYDALRESLPSITERQRQVIELIARGCSNDEVGERLGISPRTAKAHFDVLRQKLGVPRRRDAPAALRALTGEIPHARALPPAFPAPVCCWRPALGPHPERGPPRLQQW